MRHCRRPIDDLQKISREEQDKWLDKFAKGPTKKVVPDSIESTDKDKSVSFPNRSLNSPKPGPRRKSRMTKKDTPSREGRYNSENRSVEPGAYDSGEEFEDPTASQKRSKPVRPRSKSMGAPKRDIHNLAVWQLKKPELQEALNAYGEDTKGKVSILQERLRAARKNKTFRARSENNVTPAASNDSEEEQDIRPFRMPERRPRSPSPDLFGFTNEEDQREPPRASDSAPQSAPIASTSRDHFSSGLFDFCNKDTGKKVFFIKVVIPTL